MAQVGTAAVPMAGRRGEIADLGERERDCKTMAVVPSLLRAPLLPRRSGTADPHSGASRARTNSACTAKPANAKKPKRPGSFRDGEPPAKRVVKPQSKPSISELIEKARLAKARPSTAETEPLDPREIERRRTAARRELEQMVATVEFNDPFIDPLDVTRSRQELIQAREQAWSAQRLAVARPPAAVARTPAAEAMPQSVIERCRAEPKQGVVYTLILT
ncbi:hypothetical protein BRADI_3g10941v3 [Brachypodium distachyon]|uniref:Uncharacterized protein n=1 Tax=Brachypodium distachyon TaxID=15368 RepID=A0A0Q3LPQ8_BRADI|nr:hypothetical protein BRADI_3g10941v3 [Brachypodium distachyon]